MTLSSENERFYDSKDYNEVISFDSKKKAPGYIYNTILYLYDRNGELKYAPISRYEEHNYISMKPYPFFEDYYIELKILYVNEDIYAIIGVGQGYDIDKYFEEYRKKHNIFYTNPYNMILSEKDSITTYYKGKYYPNGLIINSGDRFQMSPSTNKLNYLEYYKIRKVDKLNVETVNKIAKELQNNVLKDSIKYHFDKRNNKNNQP